LRLVVGRREGEEREGEEREVLERDRR